MKVYENGPDGDVVCQGLSYDDADAMLQRGLQFKQDLLTGKLRREE